MNRTLGHFGESWATALLKREGYHIIDRNVRYRCGELDIVAREGEDLVFVEVKCRRSTEYGSPEQSISPQRYDRLALAVGEYVAQHDLHSCPIRIDVVALEVGAGGRVVRHALIRGIESPRRS